MLSNSAEYPVAGGSPGEWNMFCSVARFMATRRRGDPVGRPTTLVVNRAKTGEACLSPTIMQKCKMIDIPLCLYVNL
jgi:hypothetical protein